MTKRNDYSEESVEDIAKEIAIIAEKKHSEDIEVWRPFSS